MISAAGAQNLVDRIDRNGYLNDKEETELTHLLVNDLVSFSTMYEKASFLRYLILINDKLLLKNFRWPSTEDKIKLAATIAKQFPQYSSNNDFSAEVISFLNIIFFI